MKIYMAGPLGFSEAGRDFHKKISRVIEKLGYEILDPWQTPFYNLISRAKGISDLNKRQIEWEKLNPMIGRLNTEKIDKCDVLLAVLDGPDVDSGTAAEIGYAYAKGKKIYGYRGDERILSDNVGAKINLQVEYFIVESGGQIFHKFRKLVEELKALH